VNYSDYQSEVHKQLSDPTFYHPREDDPTQSFLSKIRTYLQAHGPHEELSCSTVSTLCPDNPRTPKFYLLPKTHKPGNTGRPIISSIGSPTERISASLDYHLQPFVQTLPSYIKDTNQFLSTIHSISDPLPTDTILVTVDVTSLYTNIPHIHDLAALEHFLDTRPSPRKSSTPFLLQLAQFVLTMNNFTFENHNFLQIKDTAMGTRMPPSYANLFMGHLKTQYLNSTPLIPFTLLRYIDDIFLIWIHGHESLEIFLQNLNCTFPVKFTCSFSREHISFLDVDVWLKNNRLKTGVHIKPTNSMQYLHFNSSHPYHTKRSLP